MDELTAQLIVITIAGIGFVVWFFQLRSLRQMHSLPVQFEDSSLVERADLNTTMRGLLKSLVTPTPAMPMNAPLMQPQLSERRDNGVRLTFPSNVEADIELEERYEGTAVHALLDFTRMATRRIRAMSAIVFVVPFVILVIAGIIWQYVVPAGHPAVRYQVFQTCQIVHILWPPFLISTLYKRQRQAAEQAVRNLLLATEVNAEEPV